MLRLLELTEKIGGIPGKTLCRIEPTNLLNEIQNILIINKLNVAPVNCFLTIFFLLHLEDVLHSKLIMRAKVMHFRYTENIPRMLEQIRTAFTNQPDWNVAEVFHLSNWCRTAQNCTRQKILSIPWKNPRNKHSQKAISVQLISIKQCNFICFRYPQRSSSTMVKNVELFTQH